MKNGIIVGLWSSIYCYCLCLSDNGDVSVEGKFDNIETGCNYRERFLSGHIGIGWKPVRTSADSRDSPVSVARAHV